MKIIDLPENATLFRPRPVKGHMMTSEKNEIYHLMDVLPNADYVSVSLTQGLGTRLDVDAVYYPDNDPDVKFVREYQTSRGKQYLHMSRYMLANLDRMILAVKGYIGDTWRVFFQHVIEGSSPLVRGILEEAQRYSESPRAGKDRLVKQAIILLAVNRMIERSWTLCGSETLGMSPIQDPDNPWRDRIPITPAMDTQIDQIIIQRYLMPLRKNLMVDLKAKIAAGKREDWFSIFLTTFILQTNTECLARHCRGRAKRHGEPRRYKAMELVRTFFDTSNIILANFHHKFNKSSALLLEAGTRGDNARKELPADQALFLSQLINTLSVQKEHLQALRAGHKYEDEMFWSHRVFTPEWEPVPLEIEEE